MAIAAIAITTQIGAGTAVAEGSNITGRHKRIVSRNINVRPRKEATLPAIVPVLYVFDRA
jgi:hypothetical protein